MSEENKEQLERQEGNWRIMSVLQIPWHHIDKLAEEDRLFLLNKADEVEGYLRQQHEEQMKQQQDNQTQIIPPSPIITPN